jgi:hypothetical protein
MKKLLCRILTTFLCLFVMTSFISGQEEATTFNLERQIILNGESENLEVILSVSEQDNGLILKIKSNIQEGDLTIEIYNPKNEKQGNYSIGSQLKSTKSSSNKNQTEKELEALGINKEKVQGTITRSIENPLKGNWVVKIIPKNAKGMVTIVSDQLSNNRSKK